MSDTVRIVEVGPRDGLQNEPVRVPARDKIAFADALIAAGCAEIEIGSFVRPDAVPQMADSSDVIAGLARRGQARLSVLVPNLKGFERARAAGVDEIAVFAAATDDFSIANIGCTINASFDRFGPLVDAATTVGIPVRGYVSVAFWCPYGGIVAPARAVAVAERLLRIGCHQIAIADTIGSAEPAQISLLLRALADVVPIERTALHLHDTGGLALANVAIALEHGVLVFDAAAGGLGGCPFAPGAAGNLATEKLVRWLRQEGIETGIDDAAVEVAAATVKAQARPAPA